MRRVAAKFVPKLLNCDQKQHRMNIANEMLDSVRDDPNLLQRVITGDEAWVYGYDVETKAQSSQWKLPHEPRPKKARQVRSNVKVLLTVFFDCRGVVHHEFLPQAFRQKRPDLWKNKNWLLHHDNAPAHTSLLVRDLLAKNNTLMMPQPPYSPDLPPCDFFLFPKLKRPMKGRRYATLDEIKTASKEELKKIEKKKDFLKCFEDWKNRWHKCIISHGDYFEGDKIVLDDLIQCTERDEFTYQEMISFLPLNCHPNPKKVLIIGGGDGGVAREVAKHPQVETIVQCELDEEVVEVSKKYLPFTAQGFYNPKLQLNFCDGVEFMKQHKNEFDVIITDSPDPKGPAVCLFQKPYYQAIRDALKDGGILCSQGESIWFDLKLIEEMNKFCKTLFPVVDYATIYIPTYPGGQIGFLLCSKDPSCNLRSPIRQLSSKQLQDMKLRYYTSTIHEGAFIHPNFVESALNKTKQAEEENGN
ncbi:SRM [Cordylochernes scorpioides]|uniref:SRM n=1 Tax=Cordylochernes scorpioides TaxID=51811 RepID=A0ABY6KHB0_9ARAC|nr:SRM [Cordylochernes scorpioides]